MESLKNAKRIAFCVDNRKITTDIGATLSCDPLYEVRRLCMPGHIVYQVIALIKYEGDITPCIFYLTDKHDRSIEVLSKCTMVPLETKMLQDVSNYGECIKKCLLDSLKKLSGVVLPDEIEFAQRPKYINIEVSFDKKNRPTFEYLFDTVQYIGNGVTYVSSARNTTDIKTGEDIDNKNYNRCDVINNINGNFLVVYYYFIGYTSTSLDFSDVEVFINFGHGPVGCQYSSLSKTIAEHLTKELCCEYLAQPTVAIAPQDEHVTEKSEDVVLVEETTVAPQDENVTEKSEDVVLVAPPVEPSVPEPVGNTDDGSGEQKPSVSPVVRVETASKYREEAILKMKSALELLTQIDLGEDETAKIEKLEEQNIILQNDNDLLKDVNAVLEKRVIEYKQKLVDELEIYCAQKELTDKLNRDLHVARDEILTLKEQVNQQSAVIKYLTAENAKKEEQSEHLEKHRNMLLKDIEVYRSQKFDTQAKIAVLNNEVTHLNQRVKSYQLDIGLLINDRNTFEAALKEKDEQYQIVLKEYAEMKQKISCIVGSITSTAS